MKAGLEPTELAAKVGLKKGMISRGELYSNFSSAVQMLLAMELRNHFHQDWLKPYAAAGWLVHYYNKQLPKERDTLLRLVKQGKLLSLVKGEEVDSDVFDDADDGDEG